MTAAKTLEIRGLRKTFATAGGRRVEAVRDFSLAIAAGEFVTLLGPSSCGKTTVLRTATLFVADFVGQAMPCLVASSSGAATR